MNTELQQALTQLILLITQGIDTASEFGRTYTPLIVRELLDWHILLNSLGFIATIWVPVVFGYCLRQQLKKDLEYSDTAVLYLIISVIGAVCTTFPFVELAQLIYAPNIWLLEFIKDYI